MKDARLIVGLGNPGREYEYTRHNIGFLTVEYLLEKFNLKLAFSSFINGYVAETTMDGHTLFFLLPQTYVNCSGVAVKKMIEKKRVSLKNTLIICDDLNLNFFQIRIKSKGSSGGHNGLKSIIDCLGTQEFPRLRMGINHPGDKHGVKDYVLTPFDKNEQKQLDDFIKVAGNCCDMWLEEGISKTMEKFNRRIE